MIVVCTSADNSGNQGGGSFGAVTDVKGHIYQDVATTNDPAAANAGQTVVISYATITTPMISTDQVTLNFNNATPSKASTIWKVTAASTQKPQFVTGTAITGATANPSSGAVSVNSQDAIIFALAREGNSAVTGDSDTTNGSWSTLVSITADTGTALTSSQISTQYKVVSGTGNQTWDVTASSSDWAIAWMEIAEVPKTRYVLIT